MTKQARLRRVLLDTSPLVAIRNPVDSQHRRCLAQLQRMEPPLITTWAVITEAAWMLRRDTEVVGRMLRGAAEGLYIIGDLTTDELPQLDDLRRQYADLSPQLADLSLLYLAEREGIDTVFTLDQRDFSIFRPRGKHFRLVPNGE